MNKNIKTIHKGKQRTKQQQMGWLYFSVFPPLSIASSFASLALGAAVHHAADPLVHAAFFALRHSCVIGQVQGLWPLVPSMLDPYWHLLSDTLLWKSHREQGSLGSTGPVLSHAPAGYGVDAGEC